MNGHSRALGVLVMLNVLWAPVNWAVQSATTVASPLAVALIRFVGFALIMWLVFLSTGARSALGVVLPRGWDAVKCVAIGLLLAGPAHVIYYTALQYASTSETTAINTTGPFWTTFFAILILSERVSALRWVSIAGGAMGAYLVSMGFNAPSMTGDQRWNLLYLCGTLLECIAFVFATRILRRTSGIGTLGYEMVGVALCMALSAVLLPSVTPVRFEVLGPTFWLAMGYLILIAGVMNFGAWYAIAERAPVSLMLLTLGIQAPVAALIGHFGLGEPVTPGLIVGGIVILTSLAVGAWDARREEETGQRDLSREPEFLPEPS